jgi:hypothetical protein
MEISADTPKSETPKATMPWKVPTAPGAEGMATPMVMITKSTNHASNGFAINFGYSGDIRLKAIRMTKTLTR